MPTNIPVPVRLTMQIEQCEKDLRRDEDLLSRAVRELARHPHDRYIHQRIVILTSCVSSTRNTIDRLTALLKNFG